MSGAINKSKIRTGLEAREYGPHRCRQANVLIVHANFFAQTRRPEFSGTRQPASASVAPGFIVSPIIFVELIWLVPHSLADDLPINSAPARLRPLPPKIRSNHLDRPAHLIQPRTHPAPDPLLQRILARRGNHSPAGQPRRLPLRHRIIQIICRNHRRPVLVVPRVQTIPTISRTQSDGFIAPRSSSTRISTFRTGSRMLISVVSLAGL